MEHTAEVTFKIGPVVRLDCSLAFRWGVDYMQIEKSNGIYCITSELSEYARSNHPTSGDVGDETDECPRWDICNEFSAKIAKKVFYSSDPCPYSLPHLTPLLVGIGRT